MGSIWLGESPTDSHDKSDFEVFCQLIREMDRVRMSIPEQRQISIVDSELKHAFDRGWSPSETYKALTDYYLSTQE